MQRNKQCLESRLRNDDTLSCVTIHLARNNKNAIRRNGNFGTEVVLNISDAALSETSLAIRPSTLSQILYCPCKLWILCLPLLTTSERNFSPAGDDICNCNGANNLSTSTRNASRIRFIRDKLAD